MGGWGGSGPVRLAFEEDSCGLAHVGGGGGGGGMHVGILELGVGMLLRVLGAIRAIHPYASVHECKIGIIVLDDSCHDDTTGSRSVP